MTTWREFLQEKRKDPALKDKTEPEKMKIAGEEWRKLTGKPKSQKKTRKHKKHVDKSGVHEHGKHSKQGKTQTVHVKSPCGTCNLTIKISCD